MDRRDHQAGQARTPEGRCMTEMRFGPAIFVGMLGTAFMQWRPQ